MTRSALLVVSLFAAVGGLTAVALSVGAEESRTEGSEVRASVVEPAGLEVRGRGDLPSGRAAGSSPTGKGGALEAEVRPLADELSPITGHFGPAVPIEGRTASLLLVVRRGGLPVTAEVEILAGPEAGRLLAIDATETPVPVAMYPGLVLLEVRPAGGGVCRRELRVEHQREAPLELDFAEHGSVHGTVTTADGTPVSGALVSLDGVESYASRSGLFSCAVEVSGSPQLQVSASGFAPQRRTILESVVAAGTPVDVELSPGLALTLRPVLPPGAPGSGPITVHLMPTGGPISKQLPIESTFPWERVTPLTVSPGASVRVEGLPPCKLEVLAVHGGATSGVEVAFLVEGQPEGELPIQLEPLAALAGRVVERGEPVAGARVSLRYANPIRATHRILGELAKFTRRQPVPILPQAAQEAVTDAEGRFSFGIDPRIGKPPFVTATSADGALSITREVANGSDELVFDLSRPGK